MPNTTGIDTEHGSGWLQTNPPTALRTVPTTVSDTAVTGGDQWGWLDERPTAAESAERARHSAMRRMWLVVGAVLAVAIGLVGVGIRSVTDHPDNSVAIPTILASPSMTTPAPSGACVGLTGQLVTDSAGDTRSAVGVIAAFEYAYYARRDAEAALGLVAPEAGLVLEALAAGIGSIPTATTHCVAISLITDTTAEVHLVELHPDGSRLDYLQLINLRTTETGVVITNIQKRG